MQVGNTTTSRLETHMDNIVLPSFTGSLWAILMLALVIALLMVWFRKGGLFVKLLAGIFILGLMTMMLNLLPLNGAVQILVLSVAFVGLSVGLFDLDGENRISVQNVIATVLTVVGTLSAIYWLSIATGTSFDGTMWDALRNSWATIQQIFSSGEVVYNQQVNP